MVGGGTEKNVMCKNKEKKSKKPCIFLEPKMYKTPAHKLIMLLRQFAWLPCLSVVCLYHSDWHACTQFLNSEPCTWIWQNDDGFICIVVDENIKLMIWNDSHIWNWIQDWSRETDKNFIYSTANDAQCACADQRNSF